VSAAGPDGRPVRLGAGQLGAEAVSSRRSLRGEDVAGDAGLVNVAVNVLATAPLARGLALGNPRSASRQALTDRLWLVITRPGARSSRGRPGRVDGGS
jgi:hypothetical protein